MEETHPEEAARVQRLREQQMVRYREPEPVSVSNRGCVAYTELGAADAPADYSRGDAAKHAIQYTDYRVAHSTERLADEADFAAAVERTSRELSSIKALQAHRAAMSYEMSDADARIAEAAERAREDGERRRLAALRAQDLRVEALHNRLGGGQVAKR